MITTITERLPKVDWKEYKRVSKSSDFGRVVVKEILREISLLGWQIKLTDGSVTISSPTQNLFLTPILFHQLLYSAGVQMGLNLHTMHPDDLNKWITRYKGYMLWYLGDQKLRCDV